MGETNFRGEGGHDMWHNLIPKKLFLPEASFPIYGDQLHEMNLLKVS